MKIIFVTPEYRIGDHHSGGLANYLFGWSRWLSANGHSVFVVVTGNAEQEYRNIEGVHIYQCRRGHLHGSTRRVLLSRCNSLIDAVYDNLIALLCLRKIGVDDDTIIQIASYKATGILIALRYQHQTILRLSSYSRQVLQITRGKIRAFNELMICMLERMQIHVATAVYAPSKYIAEIVREDTGVVPDVIMTPYFTRREDISCSQDIAAGYEYMLFVGRYEIHKGIEVMLDILPEFLERHPKAYFVAIGRDVQSADGIMYGEKLRSIGDAHGGRVLTLREMSHAQVIMQMKRSRIVVLPSVTENMSNVMLESLACGAIIVAPDGRSFNEIIKDGINGYLYMPDNQEDMIQVMDKAWESEHRQEMSMAAKNTVAALHPDNIGSTIIKYYHHALEKY